jgi:Uri superfamily endonuclease
MNIDRGTYQIYFELKNNCSIPVGALGFYVFPAGKYLYTGKANRQIIPSIRRLISQHKRTRMHLDFLAVREEFIARKILIYPDLLDPCVANEIAIKYSNGHPLVPNFGISSEDRCFSHLLFLVENPEGIFKKLIQAFHGIILDPGELYA